MYKFIAKTGVKKHQAECLPKLQKLQKNLRKKHSIKTQIVPAGSIRTGLITQNGDSVIDLDYNLEITSIPETVNPKKLKDITMAELNDLFSEKNWKGAQDSRSVITLIKKNDLGKILFHVDIAFIMLNSNGTACRLIHDKAHDQYIWNEIPQYKGIEKRIAKLKTKKRWNDVRDTYLKKKNEYLKRNDNDHPSFVIYVESVNEVYQKVFLPQLPVL